MTHVKKHVTPETCVCRNCQKELPYADFVKSKYNAAKTYGTCKLCWAAYVKSTREGTTAIPVPKPVLQQATLLILDELLSHIEVTHPLPKAREALDNLKAAAARKSATPQDLPSASPKPSASPAPTSQTASQAPQAPAPSPSPQLAPSPLAEAPVQKPALPDLSATFTPEHQAKLQDLNKPDTLEDF